MNYMIGFAITLVCMLIAVFAYMLVVARKLQDVLDELDVIKFGVKDVIHANDEMIKNEIHSLIDVVDRLIEIEKEFDSNIAKGTTDLVEVCKNHLCAIEDRCKNTEQMVANCTAYLRSTTEAVRSLRESTDTLEEQVTAITDYIRDQTVGTVLAVERESLCDSCKYNNDEGSANICCYCSEQALCNYEPKNAFEQAGEV